jgi:hypothetical protein
VSVFLSRQRDADCARMARSVRTSGGARSAGCLEKLRPKIDVGMRKHRFLLLEVRDANGKVEAQPGGGETPWYRPRGTGLVDLVAVTSAPPP